MEPFLISCPGCKIRLQITNPDFIGREFACPRCKSRLEVKEPTPEEVAVAASQSASPAGGETGHVTGTFRLGPPKSDSQDATTAVGEFADIESVLSGGAPKPTGKWIEQPRVEVAVPVEKLDPAAVHRAKQQRWTWLVFSIVGGTLAALVMTSLVIYILSTRQEQRERATRPPQQGPVADQPHQEKENANQPAVTDADAAPPEASNEKEAKPVEEDKKPTLPTEMVNAAKPQPENPPENADPSTPSISEKPPETADPETPDAAPKGFDSSKPNAPAASPNGSSLADTLKNNLEGSSLLGPAGESPLRKATGGLLEIPQADPRIIKPKPSLINVGQQLAAVIPEVRAEKIALVDFLDLLSQLSGAPVSLDPAVVVRFGIDPKAEVSVVAQEKTLRQIGDTALRPLGLTLIELGGGLVATLPDNAPLPPLDLVGIAFPQAASPDFEKFIRQSVDPARWGEPPAGAKLTIAEGKLQFQGSPRVAWGVKQLLDGVRAAASDQPLPPTDTALLDKPIDFKDTRPLRLDELAAKLEAAAGCEIRVDWVSLGSVGWSLETTVSLPAETKPLGDVLKQICEPRAWAFRLLKPDLIEITTFLEAYSGAEARVVSIKKQLAAGATPEKLQAELAKAIAPAVPRGADPLSLVQVLREPAVASIRGPASVQKLADAWLAK